MSQDIFNGSKVWIKIPFAMPFVLLKQNKNRLKKKRFETSEVLGLEARSGLFLKHQILFVQF